MGSVAFGAMGHAIQDSGRAGKGRMGDVLHVGAQTSPFYFNVLGGSNLRSVDI